MCYFKHGNQFWISTAMDAETTTVEQQQQPVAVTTSSLRARIAGFVATIQAILFLGHWFVYKTWVAFSTRPDAPHPALAIAPAVLSVTFISASLLGHRVTHMFVRMFYRLAAVWLGAMNFFFLAACLCWPLYGLAWIAGFPQARPVIAEVLYGAAVLITIYGLINARRIRVTKIDVELPNLPPSWRGRVAVQVTDLHLGNVNGTGFMRRIVEKVRTLDPDIVFITGDLY